MFKFYKTFNTSVSTPELIFLKSKGAQMNEGTLFNYNNGVISYPDEVGVPQYFCVKTCTADDDTITCIRVEKNMVFQAIACNGVSDYYIGMSLQFLIDEQGVPEGVTMINNGNPGCATIYSLYDADEPGDFILINFNA